MPLAIVCPNCTARLSAPEAAAGRVLKCPKCNSPIGVPAAPPAPAAVESEPAAAPATGDESGDFNFPTSGPPAGITPRKKPAGRRGLRLILPIGAGVFLLFALSCGGVVWYYVLRDPGTSGWKTYSPKDGAYRILLPAGAKEETSEDGLTTVTIQDEKSGVTLQVFSIAFPPGTTASDRATFENKMRKNFHDTAKTSRKDVTWAGKSATEYVTESDDGGLYVTRTRMSDVQWYSATVVHPKPFGRRTKLEKQFFDSFEPRK
jgi:hypothetical protein